MTRRLHPLALLLPVLLVGCGDLGRTEYVFRTSADGVDTVHVVTEVVRDLARFRCVSARSGSCSIVVFTRTCEHAVSLREARIDEHCSTRAVAHLDVAAGAVRALRGLPAGFRQCAAGDGAAPDLATCPP